ncbi:MAG TPA: YidB family protein [Gaiellaceae bacterium]
MGIMETLTGLFKSSGADNLLKGVTEMIGDGSLSMSKLKENMSKAGLDDIFSSWTGTGENKPISAEQIKQASDPGNLQAIADKAGVSVDQAADELSKVLPDVVDKLSPDGVLPADDAVKSAVSKV